MFPTSSEEPSAKTDPPEKNRLEPQLASTALCVPAGTSWGELDRKTRDPNTSSSHTATARSVCDRPDPLRPPARQPMALPMPCPVGTEAKRNASRLLPVMLAPPPTTSVPGGHNA